MRTTQSGARRRTQHHARRPLTLSCLTQAPSPANRLLQGWRQTLASVQDDLGRIRAAAGADLPDHTKRGLRLWARRANRDLERAEVAMEMALQLLSGVETCLRCAQGECRTNQARPGA